MFVGLVMADHTSCPGPEQPMVPGKMAGGAADNGAFQAALRSRRR